MKILSVNCGSSSLRWGLFDTNAETEDERELSTGAIEEVRDPEQAWAEARSTLESLEPDAVGHRVVHGGGCSIAAIEHGRSVDTSMGMTPLEGLMMGTRSGDIDPAVVLDLASRPEFGPERVKKVLNEESGLLGVSGISSDLREIEAAADRGDERAVLARNLFAHRVRRGIGAALGVLGGAEAVVFTGGIGEHAVAMRDRILKRLAGIGLVLDEDANRRCAGREGRISSPRSPIALFVVPARKEWLIARETTAALSD